MRKQKSSQLKLFRYTLYRYVGGAFIYLWRCLFATPVFLYTRAYTRGRAGHHARGAAYGFAWLMLLVCLAANFVKPAQTVAATNSTINFQARLEANTGAVVSDNNYNVEFKLYSASSGGSALWTEDYLNSASQGLTVVNGYLTANLGSQTAFPTNINWDQQLWLTMNIGGTSSSVVPTATSTTGWDGEMSPRLQLTAVPYAFRAGQLALQTGANTSTLGWAAQTTANSLLLPNEGGTLCVEADTTNCGFAAATGSTSYIQNTSSVQSGANFNIGGSGTIGGNLTFNNGSGASITGPASGLTVTVPSGNLTLSTTTSGTVTVQSASGTVSLGTSTALSANGALTLSSGGTTQTLALSTPASTSAATGAITIQSGNATVGSNLNAGAVTIDTGSATGAGTAAINIGTTNAKALAIGNTTGATGITERVGTGNYSLDGAASSTYALGASTVGGTITIGGTAQTGNLTLGSSTSAQSVLIGNGSGAPTVNIANASVSGVTLNLAGAANTSANSINIANGASAAATTVSILSGAGTAGASSLLLANNARVNQIDIGNVAAAAARTINVGTGANTVGIDTLNIGTGATTVAGGKTINIGNGTPTGAGTNLISIGSTANASTTTIQGGTGGGAIALSTGATGGAAGSIQIGNTTGANTQTINVGNNATASSSTTVNIGSTIGTSPTTIKAGTSGVLVQPASSTIAFQIQNSNGNSLLTADTSNMQLNVGNVQSIGALTIAGPDGGSVYIGAVANSAVRGTAMTFSGNEITDLTRATDTQGDGRAPPDSSTGIWEGTTNLLTNGGFESNTTSWTAQGAGTTLTRDTTSAKFGNSSLLASLPGTNTFEGASYSITVTNATTYTWSSWVKAPAGQAMRIYAVDSTNATIATVSFTGTGAWQYESVTFTGNSNNPATMRVARNSSGGAFSFNMDGAQLEQKAYATPYVETNGATATRVVARVQAPAADTNVTQGWYAARVRMDVASTANVNSYLGEVYIDNNDRLALHATGSTWTIANVNAGVSDSAASITSAYSAGQIVTAVFAWTSSNLSISINGSNFTTVSRVSIPPGVLASLEIGSHVGSNQMDGDMLWSAAGTGTLTNGDAASLNALGNSDPSLTGLNTIDSTSLPTFAWNGEGQAYSGANNDQTPQSGITLDDASIYRSAAGSLTVQGGVNSTTAFQVQNTSGSAVFSADTSNQILNIGSVTSSTLSVSMPGIVGSYASTPDTASNSVTSDFDVIAKAALVDWSPSANQMLIGKRATSATQYSYLFFIASGGKPTLNVSSNGTSATSATATASTNFINGTTHWVRATWRASDGRVQFFTSTDGTTWTQLGSNVTAAVGSIFDGTAPLQIGASDTAGITNMLNGNIYSAKLYSGFSDTGGTLENDFEVADSAGIGSTSWSAATTGETWTLNGAAQVVNTYYGTSFAPTQLNVGTATLFQNASDSTTAFQIQNASGSINLLTADTANDKISVGGNLAVSGTMAVTGTSAFTGNVGIGITPQAIEPLSVLSTFSSATAAESYGTRVTTSYATADTNLKQGLRISTQATNTSGTLAQLVGVLSLNSNNGNGGTTTSSYAYWARNDAATGATVQNAYNFFVNDGAGVGTIQNEYGLYVNQLTKGTTSNYAVYTNGSTQSFFGGNVGLGATPTAGAGLLQLAAGTTFANGIQFGSDATKTDLYRSAASTLTTDGSLTVGTNLAVTGTSAFTGIVTTTNLGAANTSTAVCRNSTNQLATCNTTGTGVAFVQGGNSFGAAGDLGTNDTNALNLRTNNATRLTVSTTGDLTFAASNTIGTSLTNGSLTLQANGTGTATLDTTGSGGTVSIASTAGTLNLASAASATIITVGGSGANTITIANTQTGGSFSLGNALTTGTIAIGGGSMTTGTTVIQGGTSTTVGSEAIRIAPAAAGALSIGNAAGTGNLTLGSSTSAQSVLIGNGSGAPTVNIANASVSGVTLNLAGAANTSANSINIANGASAAATTVSILSGAGTAGASSLLLANNARVNQIDIGNVAAAAARTINVGTGANTVGIDTLNIGTGATTVAGGKTINIGNGTPTGAGTNLISIGSTANASTTTIQGGTGSGAVSIQSGASGTLSVGTTVQTSTLNLGNTSASSTTLINGGTGLSAISLQAGAGGTITIGTSGSTANATTVNIANTTGAAIQTVNIGSNSNVANVTNIQGGNGTAAIALTPQTTGTIVIGAAGGSGSITLGSSSTTQTTIIGGGGGVSTVQIAGGSAANVVQIANTQTGGSFSLGNALTTGTIAIGGGSMTTGTTVIQGGTSTTVGSEAIRIAPAAAGALSIGNAAGTGNLTLGSSTSAQSVLIGNGSGASTVSIANNVATATGNTVNIAGGATATGLTDTVNIATGNSAGTGAKVVHIADGTPAGTGINTVTIGSTANASTTILQGGTAGVKVATGASGSSTAFQVQAAASANAVLAVDNTNLTVTTQAGTDAAILGSELALVPNNFNTQWTQTPAAGWQTSPTTTQAIHNTGNTSTLQPTTALVVSGGNRYQVTYTVASATAGTLQVDMAGYTMALYNFDTNAPSSFTDTIIDQATNTNNLVFTPSSTFNGTISAVSVKLVTLNTHPSLVVKNASGGTNIEVRASNDANSILIGANAGSANVSGTFNTVLGTNALEFNTSGGSNSAFGYEALQANTTGSQNTAQGIGALGSNTSGSFNAAFGPNALASNLTANSNTAVGVSSLQNTTSGGGNVGIGTNALQVNVTGTHNTAVGQSADVLSVGLNNATAIGSGAKVGASNNVILGSSANVGIRTFFAPNALTVSPQTYGTNGSAGTGTTITQSTTTVTGVGGTAFVAGMVGGTLYYNDGTTTTISSVNVGAQTMVVVASKTIGTAATYNIVWGGFNVSTTGATLLQTTTNSTSAFQIQNASGSILLNADTTNATLGLGATGTSTLASIVNLATSTAAAQDINIGSAGTGDANAGTTVSIQGGTTAGTAVLIGTNTTGGITLDTGTTGSILIGAGTTSAKTIQIGPSATDTSTTTYNFGTNTAGTQTFNIGSTNAATVAAAGTTVSIQGGTGANAISIGTTAAVNQVTIGSTNGASNTTIQGGTANINLLTNSASANIIAKTGTNSVTGFQVQNSSNAALFGVDTSGNNLTLQTNNSPQSGTFSTTNAMTIARTGQATVVSNGYIYSMGSTGSSSPSTSVEFAKLNANGTTGTWATTTTLPATMASTEGIAANGYVYVLGGDNGSVPHDTGVVYYAHVNGDGSLGTWQTSSNNFSSNPTSDSCAVTLNGYAYVIGGSITSFGSQITTVSYAKLNADGSTGTWATTTVLNTKVEGAGCAVANGHIYVVGGYNGTSEQTIIQYATPSPTAGTIPSWTTNGTNFTAAGEGSQAVALNGYLYRIGGNNNTNPLSTIEYATIGSTGALTGFNTTTNGLGNNRYFGQVAVANGYMYYVGGYASGTTSGGGTSQQSTVLYATTPRISVAGSLDLVGTTDVGALGDGGATGGSLTAGNTNIVGNLTVSNTGTFNQGLGVGGTLTAGGALAFVTASSGALTVQPTSTASNFTLTLPAETGTICTNAAAGVCSTAGTGFILDQSSSPGSAQTGNFNITGTGIANILQAATVDSPSGTTTLAIGTTNATAGINLNQNTQITGNLTFAPGATRTISVATPLSSGAGNQLTIQSATGNTAGAGGALLLQAGTGGGTSGAGGLLTVQGGNAAAGASAGGGVSILGGTATTTGAAAVITVTAGNGVSGQNTAGGAVNITSGNGGGTQVGGAISLQGGSSGTGATGNGGAINLTGGAAASTNGNGGNIILQGGTKTGSGTGGIVALNNSASQNLLSTNTSNQVVLGTASALNGSLVFDNGTNGNQIALTSGATTGTGYSLTLPTSAPTTGLCLETSSGSATQLVFSACANSNASITEVSDVNAFAAGASTTTINDSPTTVGDLLVLVTQIPNGSTSSVSSISGGGVSSWSKVQVSAQAGSYHRVEMWMGTVTATGAATATVTYSSATGNGNEINLSEYTASGINAGTTWGVDASGAQANASSVTTITWPSLTAQNAGEAYIGYAQSQNGSAAGGCTAGFTCTATANSNVLAYNTNTAANTAYAPTATQTSGQYNSAGAIFIAFVSSTAINNSTSVQQANFNVQASAAGSVAGVLQAATSGTGDILDFYNGTGSQTAATQVLSVNNSGNLVFGGLADQTISVTTQATSNTAGVKLTLSAATGNGTGAGGLITLQGGAGGATGAGGGVTLQGGASGGGNTTGGGITLQAGAGAGTGTGAAIGLTAANGGGGNAIGGAVNITAGNGTASSTGATGGIITLQGGNAAGTAANNGGAIYLIGGTATSTGTAGDINLAVTSGNVARGRVNIGTNSQAAQIATDSPVGSSLVVANTLEVWNSTVGGTAQILFTNTGGTNGFFRMGSGSGDLYWQGGGGQDLQVGAYWPTVITGDRGTTTLPSFVAGTTGTAVNIASSAVGDVALQVSGVSSSQTGNLFNVNKNSGAAQVLQIAASGALTSQVNADSATAFQILRQGGNSILTADTSTASAGNGKLVIGSATSDANQTLLQLDSFSTFADTATCGTTTNQGALYYNSNASSNAVRSCVNGNWEDLVSTSGLGLLLFGVVPDSANAGSIGDLGGISGYANSPCMVTKTGANQVTVQPCVAYSGGRKVIVASTNLTPSLAINAYQNICINGSGVPAFVASASTTETSAGVPTFSANNPILCLATVRGGGSANTIANIYDTRTFTTTEKTFATINSVNSPGWVVINSGATSLVTTGTANTTVTSGVIITSTGTASTTAINAIIATGGPQFVKATGTNTPSQAFNTSTTTGYGTGGNTTTAGTVYGRILRGIDTTCASTTSGDCEFSAYVRLDLN